MKSRFILILLMAYSLNAKVNVVASLTDMADIARQIGGKNVSVVSIARGNQDPHYVEVLPSSMIKVKKADMYLMVGMELDQWAEQIIDGSRNRHLRIVDCSARVKPLNVPTRKVDASMGDIHPNGNPHYWLSPENGKLIAQTIAVNLQEIDPAHSNEYERNLEVFLKSIDDLESKWGKTYEILRGQSLIYYHDTWPYFNEYFGLKAVVFIEPKPGIMPTPTHLDQLIRIIRDQEISVIAMEPYFSTKATDYLKQKTGVQVVKMAQSVGAQQNTESYQEMLTYNLEILKEALSK
ncbi:MAG: metal ABC transporter substrate-binding protein [Candidatus Marinimicrobia bacterium]|nr:metal ABC transporter substrate-binding protein [Candidatus Neomarinimicrobiota bacterium]